MPEAHDSRPDGLDQRSLIALIDASRAINDELTPAGVCQLIAAHAATVLDAEGSSVLLYDAARHELVFYTVIGSDSSAVKNARFSADLGIAGHVIKTRGSEKVDDVANNKWFYSGIDEITKIKTRNLLAVPMIHHNEVLGVVEVINRRGGGFSQRDLELLEVLANLVAGAARNANIFDELNRTNRGLQESVPQADFIGQSAAFKKVLKLVEKVAPSATTVLLEGESGTGKEMAASAIHALSNRHDKPYIVVNCAALPESLIESELFGHEQGAFTGATSRQIGRFELAQGGTILLDEIGELKLGMQSKLLRALETQEITRVGGNETISCDVRVLAATNRDLKALSKDGLFRVDLYYRLGVFPIELPPLRDRIDDLPLLVEHLMARIAPSLGVSEPEITSEALDLMATYRWPGNVRELRNVVERAALLAEGGVIRPEHLPAEIAHGTPKEHVETGSVLAEQEREFILKALEETNWNQSAAARHLGITRDILRYRVKRYNLAPPETSAAG